MKKIIFLFIIILQSSLIIGQISVPINNSLLSTNCTDNFESNNTSATATLVFASALNSGSSNYTLSGNIGYAGDQDWFKVNIGYSGTLTAILTNPPFQIDIELYGPSGLSQFISGSYNSGAVSQQITYTYTGSSTTVYVKVYPHSSSNYTTASCYSLQFVWTPSCPISSLTPTNVSPGTTTSPGQSITTLTPTLSWNYVTGSTNYGVYIRDMSTNTLVYDVNCAASTTSLVVPSGILIYGHIYRWNVQANVNCATCVSGYSTPYYFQITNPCTPVTISNNPVSQSVCSGYSATFSVNVNGTSPFNYQWYSNQNGVISGATNASYTTSVAGTYYCIVTNCSGYQAISNSAILTVNTIPTAPTGIDNSTPNVCQSSTATVNLGGLGQNPSFYGGQWVWYSGSCGGVQVGTGSDLYVNLNQPGITTYFLRAEGICGNSQCVSTTLTVNPTPTAPNPTIQGGNNPCQGTDFTLLSGITGSYFEWYAPDNSLISNDQNPVISNGQSGQYCLSYEENGCMSDKGCVLVSFNPIPDNAGVISGITNVCQGQSAITYTVPNITNASSYVWTLPTGATGLSSTNSITVDFSNNAISDDITVHGTNACGDGISSSLTIIVNSLPSNADIISGLTSVCQGTNNITYTVPSITNADSYIWTIPVGATGSSSTNSITIDFGTTAQYGNITVEGTNSCGIGTSSTLPITVYSFPGAAGTISGLATVCQGQNSVTYSVPLIPNTGSYVWTLPTGTMGSSTTNSINVNYGTSALTGNITVKGTNSCGIGASSTLPITINSLPGAAGTISGLTTICQGQSAVSYTVPTITNASSYVWTLPTGSTGSSTTNSINVNFGTSALTCNITVHGTNLCGLGPLSTLPITVNELPSALSLISGDTIVSQGQQNVMYTVPQITNATSYLWTLPNGAAGSSTTNSINVDYSITSQSGNIKVKGVNACGNGIQSILAITVIPLAQNCSALFTMLLDTTTPHHYFVVNNASGTPPLQYVWSWGDGTANDITAFPSHTYSVAGYYKICLTITDSTGCTNTYCDSSYLQKSQNTIISIDVIPQGTLGISSFESTNLIKIYPNPVIDELTIETSLNYRQSFKIVNLLGQTIYTSFIDKKTTVNTASFPNGVYILKLNTDKESVIKKFVKK